MSSYILFYKEFKDIKKEKEFLICRSYHGAKIDNREIKTYYKMNKEGIYKPPEILKEEVNEQVKKLQTIKEENGNIKYPNVRLKKHTENSAYYICDKSTCSMTNLLGGQKNEGESSIDCLLRELAEEIFLNFDEKTKNNILQNIKEKINKNNEINIDRITIYIVNFDILNEITKKSINAIYENPEKFLSKEINLFSVVDVEIGEVQSLEWVNYEKLNKLPSKFLKNDVLLKFLQNLDGIAKKDFFYKYGKYKQKYLELKKYFDK